jgi:hypothetical protein
MTDLGLFQKLNNRNDTNGEVKLLDNTETAEDPKPKKKVK